MPRSVRSVDAGNRKELTELRVGTTTYRTFGKQFLPRTALSAEQAQIAEAELISEEGFQQRNESCRRHAILIAVESLNGVCSTVFQTGTKGEI